MIHAQCPPLDQLFLQLDAPGMYLCIPFSIISYQVLEKLINAKKKFTERLFMRRYSTSLMESFVLSAITLSGIVLSSDGRL
jgi:hypothetical protein